MDLYRTFPKTAEYLKTLDLNRADNLDKTAKRLLDDINSYERASQALRRRFVRGAETVEGIDRGGRLTKIKRDKDGGSYNYFIEGANGTWSHPEERIWVVAMYGLWQNTK